MRVESTRLQLQGRGRPTLPEVGNGGDLPNSEEVIGNDGVHGVKV